MNLMISSQGKSLQSQPNPRFGRTPVYIQYNTDDGSWEAFTNPAMEQSGGAGVAASQFLIDKNTHVAISGRFGPNAFQVLSAAGIKMLTFDEDSQTIQEVIDHYKNENLHHAD